MPTSAHQITNILKRADVGIGPYNHNTHTFTYIVAHLNEKEKRKFSFTRHSDKKFALACIY